MVVRVAGWSARAYYRSMLRAAILFTSIAVGSIPTQAASSFPNGSPTLPAPFAFGGGVVAPTWQTQVFDPAASQLFALWSYGAMSVIAPIVYGDFLPPTALSSSFGLSAVIPMPLTAGSDPAVAAVLDTTLQQGLLPSGGAAEAQEFNIDSSGPVVALSGAVADWSAGLNGAIPSMSTVGEVGANQANSAGGVEPICYDDQLERRLQSGGEFWSGEAASASPVQFPPGLFTKPVEIENPLGGLGPNGNATNLNSPGPAGGWCRPPHAPFAESSPLEDRLLWIGAGIMLGGILVFWLSRGLKIAPELTRPAI